jgi:23S rRNA pseudouridine1911/1915/1917 synthase
MEETPSSQHSITPTLQYSSPKPQRLDAFLARERPQHSRSRWQQLIKDGQVRVNGELRKANHDLKNGDVVTFTVPEPRPVELVAQDIPLDILFEDADLIVLNKPPGLVIHPAPGHDDGTLVNALLHHCKDAASGMTSLGGIGGELRPGIVHRLDRDTSGVMVVAKSERAMKTLAEQFKGRAVKKEYVALVWGRLNPPNGIIKTSIGRSPHDRKKMTARIAGGRDAVSYYETEEAFEGASLVRVRIATGRTHQIRVHMSHIGHPIIGDTVYGRARKHPAADLANRQMLHAEKLSFLHPASGERVQFSAPVPEDFVALLKVLRAR